MRALRRKTLALVASMLALSGATVACSALLNLEPPPDVANADGGDGSVSLDAAGGCLTRYVNASSKGDDSNNGCSPDSPKKTIQDAISAFESAGVIGYTVEVCRGAYPETDLRIQSHGSVLGGYSCDTWTRTGTYATDLVNETTITVANPDSSHEIALFIGPPTVDAGVMDADVPDGGPGSLLVDGFSIQGPSGTPESYGVKVNPPSGSQSVTGTISNCKISAGDATNLSAGIYAQSTTLQIAYNTIQSGVAAAAFGIDVQTTGSSPYIHNNTITAKDSTNSDPMATGDGSIGVLVNATGNGVDGNRIDDNVVASGNGTISVAIREYNTAKGFIRRNKAQALTSTKTPGIGPQRGINVDSAGNVQVLQNRVYGGGSKIGDGPLFGIFVNKGSNVVVANNMVYGGYETPVAAPPASSTAGDTNAAGVALIGTKSPIVVYNTIFTGFGVGIGSRAYDIEVTSSIDGANTTNAVIENNILAGSGVNDFGLLDTLCTNGIDTFRNNVFLAQQAGLALAVCPTGTRISDITGLTKLGAKTLDGNITLRSSDTCGKTDAAGSCVVQNQCPYFGLTITDQDGGITDGGLNLDGGLGCVSSVFGNWSAVDDGFTTLFGGGWLLSPLDGGSGTPCEVVNGALDLSGDGGFNSDLFGKPRAMPPSMGAAQAQFTCP